MRFDPSRFDCMRKKVYFFAVQSPGQPEGGTFWWKRNSMERAVKLNPIYAEVTSMCNNGCFGGNNCWWIIILILLFSCCGNMNMNGCCDNNNNGCGCC